MRTLLTALALLLVAGCSDPDQKPTASAGRSCLPTPNTLEQPPTKGLPCSLIAPGLVLDGQ